MDNMRMLFKNVDTFHPVGHFSV